MITWLKRKPPHLSILTTHNFFLSHIANSKAGGKGKMISLLAQAGKLWLGTSPSWEASSARRLRLWGHDHMGLYGHAQFCPLAGHLSED